MDNIQALHGAPEDGVLVVQPGLRLVSISLKKKNDNEGRHTVFSVVMKN